MWSTVHDHLRNLSTSEHDLIRPRRPSTPRSGTYDRDAGSSHLLPLADKLPHPRNSFGLFHPISDLIRTRDPRDERS